MKKIAIVLFILLFVSSCATIEPPKGNLIENASSFKNAETLEKKTQRESTKRSLSEDSVSTQKTELLRERIAEFWTAFVKEDYEKIYFIYDPFFQAKTNKFAFMGNLGRLKYHSFEIKDIKVQGNVAKVNIGIVYSLPLMKLKDKEFSQPETSVEFEETWLYIYDNWYKEYYVQSAEAGVAEY